MKIKCYDKYHKQHLIIDWGDSDEMSEYSTSSSCPVYTLTTFFRVDEEYYKAHPEEHAENNSPNRWSDLENFELIP